MPLFESSALEVPSHNSVPIAAASMSPIWIYKPGFVVYSFVWRDFMPWFEMVYADNTVLMTKAVKMDILRAPLMRL